MVNQIKQLPPEIIAQIAAGEVIERPSSVIKELVENAIDAGANSIKIYIEKSGLDKIVVVDNGSGIDRLDLEISCLPHTTSKIFQLDDLLAIKSFGFRGEALASIAQISHLLIKSRASDANYGSALKIKGGQIENLQTVGVPIGTSISVENLFYSVPVRKKFLKSLATELRHIIHTVSFLALAHPQIRFSLMHNNRQILDLPKQSLDFRLRNVLGSSYFTKMISFKKNDPYFKLAGFIGKPELARQSQDKQFLFINNRHIKSKQINNLIKSSYKTLLAAKHHVPYVIFLKIPFQALDVNVHPRKDEVRFIDQNQILTFIKQSIEEILFKDNLTFNNDKYFYKTSSQTESPKLKLSDPGVSKNQAIFDPNHNNLISNILQLDKLYLVTLYKNELIIIDQHAAAERINYEIFLNKFLEQQGQSKTLEPGIELDLSLTDYEIIRQNREQIKQAGFEIKLEKKKLQITAIPKIIKAENLLQVLTELVDNLKTPHKQTKIDSVTHSLVKQLACKNSIKAGQYLSISERQKLFTNLLACENPFTCPHGRPTMIKTDLKTLGKLFKRS